MNPLKQSIEEFHSKLRPARRRLEKCAQKLATARSDQEKFTQAIAAAEGADYGDTATIQNLEVTRRQLELCEKAIGRLEEQQAEAAAFVKELIRPGASLVASILQPILEARSAMISATLEPFCADPAAALALARQTDSFRSAWTALCSFSRLPESVASAGADGIQSAASAIESVLAEALKSAPDLLQFFPPLPAAPASGTEPQTPTAVAGNGGLQ